MQKFRKYLRTLVTGGLFLMFTAVSLGAAGAVYWYRLPKPEASDTYSLLRWLVTRDVVKETPSTQQQLLRRLEVELNQGFSPNEQIGDRLDPNKEAQLHKNLEHLASLWLVRQSAIFSDLNTAERTEFLDEQVAQLRSFAAAYRAVLPQQQASAQTNSFLGEAALLFTVMSKVASWIEAAEPEQQQQMRTYVAALQSHLFARPLQLKTPSAQLPELTSAVAV